VERRHPERFENPVDENLDRNRDLQDSLAREGSQDRLDPRAKNSGHGKKTADKWNQ
jgi:hypothetical protein